MLLQTKDMTPYILLVADENIPSNSVIADAARRTGHRLRHARNSREAFQILRRGVNDVDLIIIDVDPGIHGLSVLEALGFSKNAPPVLVVTGFEELDMEPTAYRHGATACMGKPFTATELAVLINEICPLTSKLPPPMCDLWGHPRETHMRRRALHPRAG